MILWKKPRYHLVVPFATYFLEQKVYLDTKATNIYEKLEKQINKMHEFTLIYTNYIVFDILII